jgi:hypothetical protein
MGPLVCHPQKIFWPPFPKYIGLFPCQCREISQHLTDFWPPFFFFRFLLFQFLLFFLFSHTHEFFWIYLFYIFLFFYFPIHKVWITVHDLLKHHSVVGHIMIEFMKHRRVLGLISTIANPWRKLSDHHRWSAISDVLWKCHQNKSNITFFL